MFLQKKEKILKFKLGNFVIQNFDKSFHQNVPITFHDIYTFLAYAEAKQINYIILFLYDYMNWNNTKKNESEFHLGRISYKLTKV